MKKKEKEKKKKEKSIKDLIKIMAGSVTADLNPAQASATNVFYSLLIPALLLWFIYWKMSRRHMLKLAEKIPGPKGLPIIGNALDLTGSSHRECLFFYNIPT